MIIFLNYTKSYRMWWMEKTEIYRRWEEILLSLAISRKIYRIDVSFDYEIVQEVFFIRISVKHRYSGNPDDIFYAHRDSNFDDIIQSMENYQRKKEGCYRVLSLRRREKEFYKLVNSEGFISTKVLYE